MRKFTEPVTSIDDYLSRLPEDVQVTLEKIRKAIRAAAPEAEETISYQIPTFKYNGSLIGFGAAATHCALYVMSPKTMIAFKAELKGYDTATGTIRFPVDKPLPAALVKKLVLARIKENDEIVALRAKKKAAAKVVKKAVRKKK